MSSSKQAWCALNSGPSMQANLVSPLTVILQAPHIPIPSTIKGLRLTKVLMASDRVTSAVDFIISGGPIAYTRSNL